MRKGVSNSEYIRDVYIRKKKVCCLPKVEEEKRKLKIRSKALR